MAKTRSSAQSATVFFMFPSIGSRRHSSLVLSHHRAGVAMSGLETSTSGQPVPASRLTAGMASVPFRGVSG